MRLRLVRWLLSRAPTVLRSRALSMLAQWQTLVQLDANEAIDLSLFDISPVALSIAIDDVSLKGGDTADVTITFNEAVSDFSSDDDVAAA